MTGYSGPHTFILFLPPCPTPQLQIHKKMHLCWPPKKLNYKFHKSDAHLKSLEQSCTMKLSLKIRKATASNTQSHTSFAAVHFCIPLPDTSSLRRALSCFLIFYLLLKSSSIHYITALKSMKIH